MKKFILGVMTALLIATSAHAVTMYDVTIPEKSTLNGETLALNGVGLRKKGLFKVYLAALYTGEKVANPTRLLSQSGPKRIELHMLRSVSKRKMLGAIVGGFKDNTRDMKSIKVRVDEFTAYMEKANEGDTIRFDFIPTRGTDIVINGSIKGRIVGKDFFDALMKVWIGNKPVDNELKAAMLGL